MSEPKLLDPKCLEALLGYARLLFGQPHRGKVCIPGWQPLTCKTRFLPHWSGNRASGLQKPVAPLLFMYLR